jgi:glyoxylase-like metal-dependent hydrolase (beta-lactamase superfamily II)
MNLKITDEIHQVGGGRLTTAEDAAVYLIDFDGRGALVDSGCGRSVERLIDNVRSCGLDPGSVVYLTESCGQKVVFGQDVHGPLDPSFRSDPAAYQASLERLLSLGADILCEGHFGIYEGKAAVASFIRSFLQS